MVNRTPFSVTKTLNLRTTPGKNIAGCIRGQPMNYVSMKIRTLVIW